MNTNPLTEPVSSQELFTYAQAGKNFSRDKIVIRVFTVLGGLLFASIGFSFISAVPAIGYLVLAATAVGVLYVVSHAGNILARSKKQELLYKRFADANGLEFMHNLADWQMPSSVSEQRFGIKTNDDHWLNKAVVGKSLAEQKQEFKATHPEASPDGVVTLLHAFKDKTILPRANSWIGQGDLIGDSSTAYFQHHYTTGSGKSRKDHYWQVSAHRLPRKLPHILIDSRKNNSFLGSNISHNFKKDQKIDAGVLSEHFDVYVPNGYSVDALSFIGPDVIEQIIAHGLESELEIVDDVLLIYTKKKMTPESLVDMVNQQTHIIEKLGDNLSSYRDERATSIANRANIAEQGTRLSKSKWPAIFGFMGFAVFLGLRVALELGTGNFRGLNSVLDAAWPIIPIIGIAVVGVIIKLSKAK